LGVVYTIEKALQARGMMISDANIAIQGFGKVGMHAAIEAYALGARIIAVSDVSGGIHNERGINIADLVNYVKENRFVKGFPGTTTITNEELLELECDVLAPCALECVITEENCKRIRAKIVAEGANGPTTSMADRYLYEKGTMVVPDILANGGGVVVSYFEWVQDIVWLFWREDEVRNKLREIMYGSFDKVWKFSKEHKQDMRISAMAVSLQRLETAMKLRGQAW
ncbi:MAG: glutamate dehydrogenase, partial [Bdellovibrionales bacterium]|nr:glutamate dehydrogenase [Bdellovibrionales bacterium]